MELNKERKAYIEPQIKLHTVIVESLILAGSPPVNTNPSVIPPTEDDEDTNLVPEN